jgi:hypothetical protein
MPELSAETRNLITTMLSMAGLLAVAALGIQFVLVYRRRLSSRPGDSQEELAESFREAYEAGEIDTEEYRQIRASLERGPVPTTPRVAPPPETVANSPVGDPAEAGPPPPEANAPPRDDPPGPGPDLESGPRDP